MLGIVTMVMTFTGEVSGIKLDNISKRKINAYEKDCNIYYIWNRARSFIVKCYIIRY